MARLFDTLPQRGTLETILLRPDRNLEMQSTRKVEVIPGVGLVGDRFKGNVDSKRQVTLFQLENLSVLTSVLHAEAIDPRALRRNLLIRGINLNALHGRQFRVGEVVLEGTVACHPCSKMEKVLGPGGYNAMRGIGGLCARVICGGFIQVGDEVRLDI